MTVPPRSGGNRSQLFTLRVWAEESAEGRTEWRGKLQRVVDGETTYFRDWDSMLALLRQMLESPGAQYPGPAEIAAEGGGQHERE
ncbi:MAG TPA: hypothetical protein VFR15_07850 [Chloroflexia bacterium]|nr:hypothetical protein [Chloroflexia bacterium]